MKKNGRFLLIVYLFINFGLVEAKSLGTKDKNSKQNFGQFFGPQKKTKTNSVEWPLVYPDRYKAILNLGIQRSTYSNNISSWGLAFGASFEMLWEQTLFYGFGYQYNSIPKLDSLAGGSIHRISLQTGIIFQLDDYERHHLLIHLRPGMALLKSKEENGSALGVGLGLGYDYTFNSDFIIAPEIIYNWYPAISNSPFSVSGWSFGIRISFGR